MKKTLVCAVALTLGLTASAHGADPFGDVPAGHWAYDSIEKLAAAGVIDGCGAGTFGGAKLMTRYEMAQIAARAMAKGANVDKLAAEFADELDALGVRVANLEKKADAVKIAGEIRFHYADSKNNKLKEKYAYEGERIEAVDTSASVLRSRLWFRGQINDDWTYTGMVENRQNFRNETGDEEADFQRAYVQGRLGGMDITAGRQNFILADGDLYDERADMIKASYGKKVKFTVFGGRPTGQDALFYDITGIVNTTRPVIPPEGGRLDYENISLAFTERATLNYKGFYGAAVAGKWGPLRANVGYTVFKDGDLREDSINDNVPETASFPLDDNKVWNMGLSCDITEELTFSAVYMKSSLDKVAIEGETVADFDDDGMIIGLDYKGAKANEPGSWGVYGKYYDQGRGTAMAHTMNGDHKWQGLSIDDQGSTAVSTFNSGFKGWMLGADYAFAKNIVGAAEYYDLKTKGGGGTTDVPEQKVRTLWTQLVFTF